MADELMTEEAKKEHVIHAKSQEKQNLKQNRCLAKKLQSNEEILVDLLKERYWMLTLMGECLLTNLRAYAPMPLAQNYSTAFVSPNANHSVLVDAIGAMNFTGADVPVLNIDSLDDVTHWQTYGSQLTLVKSDSKMRKKLLKLERKKSFDGHLFFLTSKKFCDASILHISVSSNSAPLTIEEQDAFRAFMAKLLENPKKLVKRLVNDYEKITESPISFRIKEADAWHQVAETIISEGLSEHCEAVKTAQKERQTQKEKSEQVLEKAVELVLDPSQYLDSIATEWPADEAGVKAIFEDCYALYKKTKDGYEFLAFTEDSLIALCHDKAGLPREEINLVISRLRALEALKTKTEPTYLANGKRIRMIRIGTEVCEPFSLSPLTPDMEVSSDVI